MPHLSDRSRTTTLRHGVWSWARFVVPVCVMLALLAQGLISHDAAQPASAATTPAPPVESAPLVKSAATAAEPQESAKVVKAAATPAVPKVLFGMGGEAGPALTYDLVKRSPVHMLSSWYNGPGDLSWITNWKNQLVPDAYADGYAMHLIVYTDTPEVPIATKYGTACGRPYPLSSRFLGDMKTLAKTFAGTKAGPPLYVTLFTEFQTYPCTDNSWSQDARARRYYRALKDRYLQTMAVFHTNAPNAKVSLGWGGWQARWDQPNIGGGLSLIKHFANVMRQSDFQSFQSMATDSNVNQIRTMTKILGKYGPVMLAHYLASPAPQATIASKDLHALMTDASLRALVKDGLFAWSYMDERSFGGSSDLEAFAQSAVWRYAAKP